MNSPFTPVMYKNIYISIYMPKFLQQQSYDERRGGQGRWEEERSMDTHGHPWISMDVHGCQ
jgi:hypothetical protein